MMVAEWLAHYTVALLVATCASAVLPSTNCLYEVGKKSSPVLFKEIDFSPLYSTTQVLFPEVSCPSGNAPCIQLMTSPKKPSIALASDIDRFLCEPSGTLNI